MSDKAATKNSEEQKEEVKQADTRVSRTDSLREKISGLGALKISAAQEQTESTARQAPTIGEFTEEPKQDTFSAFQPSLSAANEEEEPVLLLNPSNADIPQIKRNTILDIIFMQSDSRIQIK